MLALFSFGYVAAAAAFYGVCTIKAPVIEDEECGEVVYLFPEADLQAA